MNVIDFHNEVDKEISPEAELVLKRIGSELGINAADTVEKLKLKVFLKTDSFKPDTPSEELQGDTHYDT